MHQLADLFRKYPGFCALLAGAASATGFAPLGLWFITLPALALWFAVIHARGSWKQAFLAGWAFGIGHFVIGLNWIAKAFTFQSTMPEWLGYVAVVLLSLYLAVFPAFAALGAWLIGRGRPVLFLAAMLGCWIISEWLRSWMFSGFIWNPLGSLLTSQDFSAPLGSSVMAPLSWMSRYIGTYGLALVPLLGAGLLWLAAQRQWRWAAACLVLLLGLWVGGFGTIDFNIATCKDEEGADCRRPAITVVQPNIGQQDKWKAGYEAQNLAKLAQLTVREDDEPRILFWPEAAIPDYLETGYPQRYYYGRSPQLVRAELASLMKPGDILVLGGLKLEFDQANSRAIGARNSVFAMNAERELLGRYDKSHLVPYGEYLPARPLLSALGLSRLVPGDLDFWPGPGPRSLELGALGQAGLQVCYEIIFSGKVVDPANRPDFIFNPSNDAWFGSWGPPQHLAQARLRAVEEAIPVIRSTPTGISAVIDANGKVTDSIAMGEAGRIDGRLPGTRSATLFARYGNILPLSLAGILLICAIAIRRRQR